MKGWPSWLGSGSRGTCPPEPPPCWIYFALSLVVPVFEVVSYPVPVDFFDVSDMPAAPAEVSEGAGAGAIPVVSAGAPAAPDSGVPGVFCRPPLQAARAMAVIEPIIHGVRFMGSCLSTAGPGHVRSTLSWLDRVPPSCEFLPSPNPSRSGEPNPGAVCHDVMQITPAL